MGDTSSFRLIRRRPIVVSKTTPRLIGDQIREVLRSGLLWGSERRLSQLLLTLSFLGEFTLDLSLQLFFVVTRFEMHGGAVVRTSSSATVELTHLLAILLGLLNPLLLTQ